MPTLALVLSTTSHQLVPGTSSNLQIDSQRLTENRQMGGSHHHKNASAHLSARAPPTTPESASLQRTNSLLFARL